MRIISGEKRGLKLNTLEGENTRPTLDRVKESVFNILSSKNGIYGNILDLFAGSGSLALEALSRGGEFAVLCDNSIKACKIIESNIEKCNYSDKAKIYNLDYIRVLEKVAKDKLKFDLIFLDPPYDMGLGIKAIEKISELDILNNKGYIVLETNKEEKILHNIGRFELCDERIYGIVKVSIFG